MSLSEEATLAILQAYTTINLVTLASVLLAQPDFTRPLNVAQLLKDEPSLGFQEVQQLVGAQALIQHVFGR